MVVNRGGGDISRSHQLPGEGKSSAALPAWEKCWFLKDCCWLMRFRKSAGLIAVSFHLSPSYISRFRVFFVCVLVTQLCLTLWDPRDYSPPGSSVHGILQAKILEWVALPSSEDLHLLHLLHWQACLTFNWFSATFSFSFSLCRAMIQFNSNQPIPLSL